MRLVFALALSLAFATAASAEVRTFVVDNDADGYGVDRCLATGASCGALVASAYCRSQDFLEARSFRVAVIRSPPSVRRLLSGHLLLGALVFVVREHPVLAQVIQCGNVIGL